MIRRRNCVSNLFPLLINTVAALFQLRWLVKYMGDIEQIVNNNKDKGIYEPSIKSMSRL